MVRWGLKIFFQKILAGEVFICGVSFLMYLFSHRRAGQMNRSTVLAAIPSFLVY